MSCSSGTEEVERRSCLELLSTRQCGEDNCGRGGGVRAGVEGRV